MGEVLRDCIISLSSPETAGGGLDGFLPDKMGEVYVVWK